MLPWVAPLFGCAAYSVVAYQLVRFTVDNYLAARSAPSRGRRAIEALLFSVVWPAVAALPWLLAISWPATRRLLESDGLFPLWLLACHVAASYPAYRCLYGKRLVDLVRAGAQLVSFWPGQVPAAIAAAREQTPISFKTSSDVRSAGTGEVEAALREVRLKEHLPPCREVVVTVRAGAPAGTQVRHAHPLWRPEAVASVGPLPPFPHREPETPCPEGVVQIDVECIVRASGGMGSYFGFEGHFYSLLVQVAEKAVFDARGQKAR